MQDAIDFIVIGSRYATPAWLLLAALATLAFLGLSAPAMRQRRAASRAEARAEARFAEARRRQATEYAGQLRRYADEVAVAAERAARTVQRRRSEWLAAHGTADAVWRAYDQADAAARRVLAASAYPLADGAPSAGELADRRRYLIGAATEAHRRGELSSEQYADVMLGRNGWDPRRHPAELESLLRRASAERLLRAYRTAAAAERAAWYDVELAAAASSSLSAEAHGAALRAAAAAARLAASIDEPVAHRDMGHPTLVTP